MGTVDTKELNSLHESNAEGRGRLEFWCQTEERFASGKTFHTF